MDIIQRNFLRLLRCGAFGAKETIEPMSAWKWNRMYQMAQMHGVTPWIYDGLKLCKGDFFLNLRPSQWQQWQLSATDSVWWKNEEAEPLKLTHPLRNRTLQQLMEEHHGTPSMELFMRIVNISRYILTQGISLRLLTELGLYLRTTRDAINYELLMEWIKKLKMVRIAQLEASLLVCLFNFKPEEIGFAQAGTGKHTDKVVDEMFRTTSEQVGEWYFTQGKNVFVGTSNSGAMMWHVRHSAKYMHYYPSEAITNFAANFAHSLSHIEE